MRWDKMRQDKARQDETARWDKTRQCETARWDKTRQDKMRQQDETRQGKTRWDSKRQNSKMRQDKMRQQDDRWQDTTQQDKVRHNKKDKTARWDKTRQSETSQEKTRGDSSTAQTAIADLGQELGQVDVVDGLEEQHGLFLIHVLQLQVPCCRQHRLHCSHAIVVVMLGWQLLWAQGVGGHNLVGQAAHTASQPSVTVLTDGSYTVQLFHGIKTLCARAVSKNHGWLLYCATLSWNKNSMC